jgi:hypothetical protein
MTNIRFIPLGLTLCCLALGCGGNSAEEESEKPADNGSSGASGSSIIAGSPGITETSGTGGTAGLVQEREPFFCGDTQCTALEPTDGGVENLLSLGFQYCCTPTNQCSVQLIGATACPDKVICGGVECQSFATDVTTLVGVGTVCCSPSGKCSFMAPGETECPEPAAVDPECQSVADAFGGLGTVIQDTGVGGQGCCLPDNTCGVIFMGACIENTVAQTFFNAPVYDCDGNLIEPVVPDAGPTPDAGSAADAGAGDLDSGT